MTRVFPLGWFNSVEWSFLVRALLHTLWQAVGLAALLWLVLRLVESPAARYRCATTGLATVLLAGLVTWGVFHRPVPQPAPNSISSQVQTTGAPLLGTRAAAAIESVSTPVRPRDPGRWTPWLALVWLAGATLMVGRAGFQISGAGRLRRSSHPLQDDRITALLREAERAVGLARRVQIAVTDKLTSPAVVGVIVPTLIFPLSLATALTPEQIRFVLLHELAHIRRGDYFASLFQMLAEALLFFNPAVWWISRQMRIEREACCDALAIELSAAPTEYARTLVRVAETILVPPPEGALAFGDRREPSTLAERLRRMLVPGYRPKLRLGWRSMIAALMAGGALLFLSAVGTRVTVAAILSPQQRVDRIEQKMNEYGVESVPQPAPGESEVTTTVTAHIKTADGAPLPRGQGIDIISRRNHGTQATFFPVPRDGYFSNQISAGQIWVETTLDGYAPLMMGPFDGLGSNRIDAGEIVVDHGFEVSIEVKDADSGAAMPNAALHTQFISRNNGQYFQGSRDFTSDSNGRVQLPLCIDQPLLVSVNAAGHEIMDHRFEKLAAGKVLELKVNRGAEAAGTVVDKATGAGIADAILRVLDEKGPTEGRYGWDDAMRYLGKTDASGHFDVNQLQHGATYALGISAPGHESVIVEGVSPGRKDVVVKLGPELVVRGHVLGSVEGLPLLNGKYCLYESYSEVIGNQSMGNGKWIPLRILKTGTTFEFTNHVAGRVALSGDGFTEDRDVTAPVEDWVVDLDKTVASEAAVMPKREVVFRFLHPTGVTPRGTVWVTIPDNLNKQHLRSHVAEMEITNGEVRVAMPIGGMTTVQAKHMAGYSFDRMMDNGRLLGIEVTNGTGPLEVDIPLIPAGAIFAHARNADGSPAGGLMFGVDQIKRAPSVSPSALLDGDSDSFFDQEPRKWASAPLPLGGSYQIYGWRGNAFCIAKPITLTEEKPDAEVELQFAPGKTFYGIALDTDGKPLAGAEISLEFQLPSSHSFGLKSAFTDAQGRFQMDDMTPEVGAYSLELNVPGMVHEMVTPDFSKQSQTFRFKRGRVLAGRVVESGTGYPIPGAKVTAVDFERHLSANTTQTDDDGRFTFDTLSDAHYKFFVAEVQELSDKTFPADGSTNIVLTVKLYDWSKVKAKPPGTSSLYQQTSRVVDLDTKP